MFIVFYRLQLAACSLHTGQLAACSLEPAPCSTCRVGNPTRHVPIRRKTRHGTARHVGTQCPTLHVPTRRDAAASLEDSAGAQTFIEFKDSLADGAATSQQAATRLLQNLKLTEECPAPSNRAHQSDDWSCGLWATRWVERQLREVFGEPRLKPRASSIA